MIFLKIVQTKIECTNKLNQYQTNPRPPPHQKKRGLFDSIDRSLQNVAEKTWYVIFETYSVLLNWIQVNPDLLDQDLLDIHICLISFLESSISDEAWG